MALAQRLLATLNRARAVAGRLGFRPFRVYLVQGAWSGDVTGAGDEFATVTEITEANGQSPKVRSLNDERKALGQLPGGTVEIGPITPAYAGGGTDLSLLLGTSVEQGETYHLRLVGPGGTTHYAIREVQSDRALRYMLTAIPVSEAFPDA